MLEGRDLVGLWLLHLAAVAIALALSRRAVTERWRPAMAALAAFAAGVALHGEPEAIVDASRYFVQAKHLAQHGARAFLHDWGGELPAWTDLPLAPVLYGMTLRLAGEHRLAIQLLTAGLFALTVYATARIGALLWCDETGIGAALLLLAIPCLLVQVPLLMADVPAMAAVTVALWAWFALLERGGAARFAAAALAIAAALLAKYSVWVLLGGTCGAVLVIEVFRGRRAALARGCAAALAGAIAPALYALTKPEVVERQLGLLAGFQREGLLRWVESYPSTFLFQAHPLLAGAALAALWRGWRERDRRVLAVAVLPLLLFALGIRRSRYLLPAFPMIALLAARGLGLLAPRARRFAILAAVGFSLVMVFAAYLPFLGWINTANLQAAGRYLDERGVPAAEVVVLPSPGVGVNPEVAVPLLDYHTAARISVRGQAPPRPPEEAVRTSSFRFSWEQSIPSWYRPAGEAPLHAALVLISGDPDAPPPAAVAERVGTRPPDAVFARDAVFRYRTLVSIWLPRGPSAAGEEIR